MDNSWHEPVYSNQLNGGRALSSCQMYNVSNIIKCLWLVVGTLPHLPCRDFIPIKVTHTKNMCFVFRIRVFAAHAQIDRDPVKHLRHKKVAYFT